MAFKRILIAVDTNEIAVDAATVGLELAADLGAAVALVHVIESTVADAAWVAEPSIELSASSQGLMAHILARLKGRATISQDVVKFEPVGAAVQSIVRAAHGWAADLVVIGSHGRVGVSRALLGSVAEGVARHATCPVMIVRNRS